MNAIITVLWIGIIVKHTLTHNVNLFISYGLIGKYRIGTLTFVFHSLMHCMCCSPLVFVCLSTWDSFMYLAHISCILILICSLECLRWAILGMSTSLFNWLYIISLNSNICAALCGRIVFNKSLIDHFLLNNTFSFLVLHIMGHSWNDNSISC